MIDYNDRDKSLDTHHARSKKKHPLYWVYQRYEPTCGRKDCQHHENPEHWVDVQLAPVAAAGPELLKACLKAQKIFHDIAWNWDASDSTGDTATIVKALAFANGKLHDAIVLAGGAPVPGGDK